MFAILLGVNVNSFFILRHTLLAGAFLSDKPSFFRIFQSFFGFLIFSDRLSCKHFLFLSVIEGYTVFLASSYSILSTLNFFKFWFFKFSKQLVLGGYFFCNLSIKPLIRLAFYSNSFCKSHFVYNIKSI